MKKLLLLCLVLLGGVSTVSAYDARQLYLIGDSEIGNAAGWGTTPLYRAMTVADDGFTYYSEVTLTGTRYFAIADAESATWDDLKSHRFTYSTDAISPGYGGYYSFTRTGDHSNTLPAGRYVLRINSKTMQMYISPNLDATRSYYVVGNNARVFDAEWNITSGAQNMAGSSNVYTYVKEGVYLFKGSTVKWKVLMKDGENALNWNYGYAGSGYVGNGDENISNVINEDGIYTLTFTFNLNNSVVPTATCTKTAELDFDYLTCYVNDKTGWTNTKLYAWATGKEDVFGGFQETVGFTPETEVIGGTTYKKYPFIKSDGSFQFIFSEGGSNDEGYRVVSDGYTADRNYYITLTTSSATTDKATVNVKATKEYSTFCNTNNLDFDGITGLEAYRVSEVTETAAKMAQVTAVPGGQGLILKKTANVGSATTFQVPIIASAESIGDNALVGVTAASGLDMSTVSNAYILSDGLFYECNGGTLAAGKAYLSAAAWAGSKETSFYMIFEDENETNAINAVKLNTENGAIYNLAGQKVGANYKGIVVVNGKKVVRK